MASEERKEPIFLSRDQIDACHQNTIETFGGDPGLRNESGLESAVAQPQQLYHYTEADHYDVAAAYAFHIAESQAYVDGNKRTAIAAAAAYLEINGIDTSRLPEQEAYEMMIGISGPARSAGSRSATFSERTCSRRRRKNGNHPQRLAALD